MTAIDAGALSAAKSQATAAALLEPNANKIVPTSSTLYFSGNTSYQIQSGLARLTADNVSNDSYTYTTGTLRLALWLSAAPFPSSGYRTATYTMGQLSPRHYFYNIDSGFVTFSSPPAGCYYVTMLLEQYTGPDYVYDDYVAYTNRISVNGGCGSPAPTINSFTASPSTIVAGASSLLSWSTSNATSASIGGTAVSTSGSASVSPSVGNWTYTLTASNGSTQVTRSVTVTVTSPSSPLSVSISGSPTSGQAPFTSSFSATAAGGSPPYTYRWLTGETGSSLSHTWSSSGTYTQRCTVTDSAGATATSNTMTITASPSSGGLCSDPKTVCLSNGRFAVRISWRTSTDAGSATPIKFTPDSGLFWFFGSDNIEVLLKILNACTLNNRYWVFSAATTDVEYTITVTDTLTGQVKTYFHSGGSAAPAITDTDAIPCS